MLAGGALIMVDDRIFTTDVHPRCLENNTEENQKAMALSMMCRASTVTSGLPSLSGALPVS